MLNVSNNQIELKSCFEISNIRPFLNLMGAKIEFWIDFEGCGILKKQKHICELN